VNATHKIEGWQRSPFLWFCHEVSPATSAPGLGLTPATSAPGLGAPLPHLHRDWAQPCHICAGTGAHRCDIRTTTWLRRARAAGGSSPSCGIAATPAGCRTVPPSIHRGVPPQRRASMRCTDAHAAKVPCHICTGTQLTSAMCICTGSGLAPATSAPGLGSPLSISAPGLGSPLLTSAPGLPDAHEARPTDSSKR
jgi:hypothetical protein